MASTEFLRHEREQVEQLKELDVPELMQKAFDRVDVEKTIAKLEKIAESIDFAEEIEDQGVNFDELNLSDEDDALAMLFYIWANPYLEEGDAEYFADKGEEFAYFLKEKCGELGKIAASIVDDDAEYLSCNHITLKELSGLEKIQRGEDN